MAQPAPAAPPPRPWREEGARTPARLRDRVLAQFASPQNRAYLRQLLAERVPRGPPRDFALATLDDAVVVFAEKEGRALDVLLSDPVARRGAARPAAGLWSEVRRLNLAFAVERLRAVRDLAPLLDPRPPRDGLQGDAEPYHVRMFTADSLRPPGLEHLNEPGPLYALREDQGAWDGPPGGGGPVGGAAPEGALNPDASAAVAEAWSDRKAFPASALGAAERARPTYGARTAWGPRWPDNGGTRFMRYESVPFWQKGGREGYEYDIEETLGTQARETANPVRRWADIERLRDPRGQDSRRYGPRTGHAV